MRPAYLCLPDPTNSAGPHHFLTVGVLTVLGLTWTMLQISLGTSTHSSTASRLGMICVSIEQSFRGAIWHDSSGTSCTTVFTSFLNAGQSSIDKYQVVKATKLLLMSQLTCKSWGP